jgi:glycosyltransferase involved in cell wall biosynthesis
VIGFKRLKVGLVFYNYENWTGGTYYILNLVNALNLLPDDKKVQLIAFTENDTAFQILKNTSYPYLIKSTDIKELNVLHFNLMERTVNKISRTLLGKNIIRKRLSKKILDVIFPVSNEPCFLPGRDFYYGSFFDFIPKLYWIPDFQEHYLPQFFSEKEIEVRKKFQKAISDKKAHIVFSSKDAEKDFGNFYPGSTAKRHILNFAVSHPPYADLDGESLKKEFDINGPYFFSPNQFWIHKNQLIILKAIKILKEAGERFVVVFSGNETDSRGHDYIGTLKKYVKENSLEAYVRFVGFIDRKKQLKLMSEAEAIIQPSLFEGWSSVVEDSKAMSQYVVSSHLNVHKEQMQHNYCFFDPHAEADLSKKLKFVLNTPISKIKIPYTDHILKFGEDFIHIVKNTVDG